MIFLTYGFKSLASSIHHLDEVYTDEQTAWILTWLRETHTKELTHEIV